MLYHTIVGYMLFEKPGEGFALPQIPHPSDRSI